MRTSERARAARQDEPVAGHAWPLVSVVVVNYNGQAYLAACVEALLGDDYAPRELIVVDNGSTDGSRDVLRALAERHPRLRVLWSDRNRGYAGGLNLALPHLHGKYVALLNMDLVVEPGWLQPLVTLLEERPTVGAVNPLVVLADGMRVNAAGQDVHVTGLGFNRWLGRPRAAIRLEPMRVSGIQGGAFLVRRALLERVGGMDESGFLYHEDVNLSWLLQLMGYSLYCVPRAAVRHDYLLSMYPTKLHLLERNRWAMLLAYLEWPTLLLLAPLLAITEALMWSYCLLRGPAFLRAKASSYAWVVAHRGQVAARRRLARRVRAVSDRALLSQRRWAYAWDQFLTLGRERRTRRENVTGVAASLVRGGQARRGSPR